MNKETKMKKILNFLQRSYGKEVDTMMEGKPDVFKLLITTILSQRTKDANTEKSANSLFSHVSSPEEILELPDKKLQELIRSSGTFRQKSINIKKLCKILVQDLNGRIPSTREELMKLPGVGNKTADIILSYGFGQSVIAVDVHVRVCSERLGLVRKNAEYDEIRKTLEKITPEKERYLVNIGFVRFGQAICLTRRPRCYICPLVKICVYNKKNLSPSQ